MTIPNLILIRISTSDIFKINTEEHSFGNNEHFRLIKSLDYFLSHLC